MYNTKEAKNNACIHNDLLVKERGICWILYVLYSLKKILTRKHAYFALNPWGKRVYIWQAATVPPQGNYCVL